MRLRELGEDEVKPPLSQPHPYFHYSSLPLISTSTSAATMVALQLVLLEGLAVDGRAEGVAEV